MGIGERKSSDSLREAQLAIKLPGAVKIRRVNSEMESGPQPDIGFGFKSDVWCLHSRLQLIVLGEG